MGLFGQMPKWLLDLHITAACGYWLIPCIHYKQYHIFFSTFPRSDQLLSACCYKAYVKNKGHWAIQVIESLHANTMTKLIFCATR